MDEGQKTMANGQIKGRNQFIGDVAIQICKLLEEKQLSIREGMIALDNARTIMLNVSKCTSELKERNLT